MSITKMINIPQLIYPVIMKHEKEIDFISIDMCEAVPIITINFKSELPVDPKQLTAEKKNRKEKINAIKEEIQKLHQNCKIVIQESKSIKLGKP